MKQETSNETDSTQIRPPASPLFPPPSSSFRPPPPLETAGASKPEERSTTSPSIKGKGRRTVSVDLSGLHRPTSNQDSNALPPSISRPGSVSLSRSNSSAVSRRARSGSVASSRASPRIDHEIPDQSSHHLAHVHSSLSTVVDSLSRHTSKPSSPILLSPLAPMMSPSTSTLNHQPIIIRDFAFGPIDPRFAGLPHPDAATKRMSASSSSTSRKSGGEEEAIAGGGSVCTLKRNSLINVTFSLPNLRRNLSQSVGASLPVIKQIFPSNRMGRKDIQTKKVKQGKALMTMKEKVVHLSQDYMKRCSILNRSWILR